VQPRSFLNGACAEAADQEALDSHLTKAIGTMAKELAAAMGPQSMLRAEMNPAM
jgi:hypothetical protein